MPPFELQDNCSMRTVGVMQRPRIWAVAYLSCQHHFEHLLFSQLNVNRLEDKSQDFYCF